MSDVIDFETGKLASTPSDRYLNAEVSRKRQNRQRLKRVLGEIGRGLSPTSGIIEGTSPSYWVIRTDDTAWEDDESEDGVFETDPISEAQYELWRSRGGRGAMLRLSADPGSYLTGHVLVWLMDAISGASCLGINFQARPSGPVDRVFKRDKQGRTTRRVDHEKLRRRFIVAEDDLSRDPDKLLEYLKHQGVVELDIEDLQKLLQRAPTLIVMPEANINVKFWEMRAEGVKRYEDVEDVKDVEDLLELDSD
jgi:hypothetical protein